MAASSVYAGGFGSGAHARAKSGVFLGGTMSSGAGLDVRWPIGGLFAVLGLMLTGYGIATAGHTALYERSLSINVNLWWGLVLLVFGAALLFGAKAGRRL